MIHKLPSLRWRRNAFSKYLREFEGDIALNCMLKDLQNYVSLTYDQQAELNEDLRTKAKEFVRSIEDLVSEIQLSKNENRAVDTRIIRPVTSAMTALYHEVPYGYHLSPDHTDVWMKAGHASYAAYP